MIIVSDTSPINNLAAIGHLHLLHDLYETVLIPDAVYRELTETEEPVAGSAEVQTLNWIEVRSVRNQAVLTVLENTLDAGEAAAIALALEVPVKQVLIDERRGRQLALQFNLRPVGILGILVEAKAQGLIQSVKPLLDILRFEVGFWVSTSLYERVLEIVEEN